MVELRTLNDEKVISSSNLLLVISNVAFIIDLSVSKGDLKVGQRISVESNDVRNFGNCIGVRLALNAFINIIVRPVLKTYKDKSRLGIRIVDPIYLRVGIPSIVEGNDTERDPVEKQKQEVYSGVRKIGFLIS